MTRAERISIRDANLNTEHGTYVECLAALERLKVKALGCTNYFNASTGLCCTIGALALHASTTRATRLYEVENPRVGHDIVRFAVYEANDSFHGTHRRPLYSHGRVDHVKDRGDEVNAL